MQITFGAAGDLFAEVCRQDLEGIVAKRADAVYDAAALPAWLKIKHDTAQLAAHHARPLARSRGD